MNRNVTEAVAVTPCAESDLEQALAFLYQRLPRSTARRRIRQALENWRREKLDLSSLLTARMGRELLGVLLLAEQAGRFASVWPPAVSTSVRAEPIADALLAEAAERLAQREIRLVQALLEPSDARGAERLARNRFNCLTELSYLERRLGRGVSASRGSLCYECYTPERHQAFAAVVERTYEGSLDCPQLNGMRPIEEVLQGYRAAGPFDPAGWLLAFEADRIVGCLLLCENREQHGWELLYVGVVPEARERGLGRELTAEALRIARARRGRRMTLAVDVANVPARRIYTKLGFRERDRRLVYLRNLSDAPRRQD